MGSVKASERDIKTRNKWNHSQLLKAVKNGSSRFERKSGRLCVTDAGYPQCWQLRPTGTCSLMQRPAPAGKVHAVSHTIRWALSLQALAIMPCTSHLKRVAQASTAGAGEVPAVCQVWGTFMSDEQNGSPPMLLRLPYKSMHAVQLQ